MKTKIRGKALAILMSLAMVFTMMPMMSQTVYADDPVYTVTLDPGEGSGDPIVFKSDVNWYESTSGNGSDVPGGNFYRYLGDGKIWFCFPDYKVPDTFTAPDDEYVFDEWTPVDMSPRGSYPISGDMTFTAQWKKDPSLLPESSYSLSPTSYTITQAGYTDIECVVTSLNIGKFEYNGQPVAASAIEFTLNKGTLTDGKGGEIPFRVDEVWHWGPYDNKSINPIDAPNTSFTAAVYIDENDFNAAAPGIYTGTYRIDSKWEGDDWDHKASGDPHYIALTLIVPDPSKSHTVTYEVVNGTWSNDETDPIEEVVVEGEKPSEVPTGMKPSEGYEGGSWSPDPTTTSITGDTKFTYTFTKKQDTEVYTVTCYPGDGSGDPVVYNSEDHLYDSWMNVPPGVFFRTYEGEMWFTAPTMPNSFSPPQEGYGVVSWNDGNNDIPVGERFKMDSQNKTLTAQYAPLARYGLAPSSYTINQSGYTDIECSFTSLVLGPIENSGEDARYIGFYLNGGTLSDGKGNSIPFKVDDPYHFGAEDRKNQGNSHSDPEETFIVAVYIDPDDYQNASPGVYKGTYKIDGRWNNSEDAPSHEIELKLIVGTAHTVTYEVANGTWSNGKANPIVEKVLEGEKPSEVPTGMKPADGYEGGSWSQDPTTTYITADTKFTYTFTKKPTPPVKISVPTGKTLTYNGKAQTGVAAGTGYTLSGTTAATKAGTYTAKAALKTGYVWADGTTAAKSIKWKINKAANPLKIKAKTATVKGSTKGKNGKLKKTKTLGVTKVIAFTKKGQGKMTYTKASGNKKITIAKTTGKVTVKKGLKKGTYSVKVKVKAAGNANYKASAVKTVTFKIKIK